MDIFSRLQYGTVFSKWIQTQRNFSVLDLSRASIRDEVPRWFWSVSPFLGSLFLLDNQISGTIPSLSSMTSLSDLNLANNSISGHISSFNANVYSVVLSGNILNGSISSICEIRHGKLMFLDLSNNKLGGEVPNCWENVPNLGILNLAKNNFSSEIPPFLGSFILRFFQRLQLIDVGGNELTGEIPTWIGEMHGMRNLNLGINKFHGRIPPEICNLTFIQIIDLSINNLSGKLPDCFNNFTQMARQDTDKSVFGLRFGSHMMLSFQMRLLYSTL
ncbi:hypothetical protein OROGR_019730 [Orobanche gracilis]